jgi:predicted dehydrogenase
MKKAALAVASCAGADPATVLETIGAHNESHSAKPPRLGFLGVGWIGRQRLKALAESGVARVEAIADSSADLALQAQAVAPGAVLARSLEELLENDLDGIVIATPSALHAGQSIAALRQGLPVFCQKPLGRCAKETLEVIESAQANDCLLGVDLSYRFMNGAQLVSDLCLQGDLGDIFAVDLIFHNAYGPDKAWFYDRQLSGGGCLIDLGTHLVDLALWCLGFPVVAKASGRLFSQGKPLRNSPHLVEDYATAQIEFATGTVAELACSWKLSAGSEAVISASFYGTKGGANLRNVNGSFYEFVAEKFEGTKRQPLAQGPEPWGGRAVINWAQRLAGDRHFNPEIKHVVGVAETLDAIYQSASVGRPVTVAR